MLDRRRLVSANHVAEQVKNSWTPNPNDLADRAGSSPSGQPSVTVAPARAAAPPVDPPGVRAVS